MKKLSPTSIFTLGFIAYSALTLSMANAIDLYNYKDSGNGNLVMTEKTVTKIWNSDQPACIKDGSSLKAVNKVFKTKGLKYKDCSNGKAAKRINKLRGLNVTVLKLADLPDSIVKQVLGIK